jgi:hypothetical protein
VYWDFNHFLCMYCKIYINYRGARLIAWLIFQTPAATQAGLGGRVQ